MKKGDTIGLIAPGYAINVRSQGNFGKLGLYLTIRIAYMGTMVNFRIMDGERAADLNEMFANKSVDGILCARGGYGCNRIMHLIDYGLIEKKALIGHLTNKFQSVQPKFLILVFPIKFF